MSGVVLPGALLLIAVLMVVMPPLLAADRRVAPATQRARRRAALESRRDELYTALREAEFDWRTGKLTDEDHEAAREGLVADAAATLRELDELGSSDDGPSDDGPSDDRTSGEPPVTLSTSP